MILIDNDIRKLCEGANPLLDPFSEGVQEGGVISYGLSHAGYDLRLGNNVLVFKASYGEVIDPKRFKKDPNYHKRLFDEVDARDYQGRVTVPPHSYILGNTYEYIKIPNWLKGRCVGKSTLARCGVIINTTPLEPGWEGYLTLEIANVTPCPLVVYAMEGIAQLEFETLTGPVEYDYAAKDGKYNHQEAKPVPARVKE